MCEETPGCKLFDELKVTSPHVGFCHWVVSGPLRGRGLVSPRHVRGPRAASPPGLGCGVPED